MVKSNTGNVLNVIIERTIEMCKCESCGEELEEQVLGDNVIGYICPKCGAEHDLTGHIA